MYFAGAVLGGVSWETTSERVLFVYVKAWQDVCGVVLYMTAKLGWAASWMRS